MASSIAVRNLSSLCLPSHLRHSTQAEFKRFCTPVSKRATFAAKIRASSTAVVETKPTDPVVVDKEVGSGSNILACPICYEPLSLIGGNSVLSVDSAGGSSFLCNCCKKTYSGKQTHLELTVASGAKEFDNAMPATTEFFRTPFISFLYERGWRQSFVWGGFPGPEKEFELIKDYIKPVLGGNILDASCGSGLFSRLFANSGLFSLVIALDYSENMLQQCYEFVKQEENFPKENLILVRADISRLPFVSGSVDAVHAGAAIHCWPSPSAAIGNHDFERHVKVAEVSRVLRPGGVFVASTYVVDGPLSFIPFLRPINKNLAQLSGSNFFVSERELEDVCRTCGLVDFTCTRNRLFIMFSAKKPN